MITRVLGSVSVTRLAEVAVMDRTTLTRNLRLLEKRGLIRIGEGEDRRVRKVTLKQRGHDLLAKAIPVWREVQAKVARDLGEERLKRMVADLNATVSVVRQG
jgi:DNA-binding MarR family transcriptional regulator